jgi:hypothetical protein
MSVVLFFENDQTSTYSLTLCLKNIMNKIIQNTTFNNGSLGSRIDEERSEMRYVMWIAEFSESSNLWTHIALFGIPKSMLVWVSVNTSKLLIFFESFGLEQSQHQSFLDRRRVAWNAGAAGHSPELKAYSFSPVKRIITFAAANIKGVWPYWLTDAGFHRGRQRRLLNSISNQVRLPAELKHINKRRKRN